jgi:peptide/nickel transport system substrate-binding protein
MMPVLRKRALLTAGGAAIAAAALTGARPAEAPPPHNTLVIAPQIDDLVALDPHHSFEITGSGLLKNVYDQLFTLDPTKDVPELQPGIAESFEVSADGRTFTVRVRKGVRFHSGNMLSPADVVSSLRGRLLINRTPAFMYRSVGLTRENLEQAERQVGDHAVAVTFDRVTARTLIQKICSP